MLNYLPAPAPGMVFGNVDRKLIMAFCPKNVATADIALICQYRAFLNIVSQRLYFYNYTDLYFGEGIVLALVVFYKKRSIWKNQEYEEQ